jgi:cell division protein FtsL
MARSVRKFKETVELRSTLLQRLRSHRFVPVVAISIALLGAACLHVWQRVMVIELAKDTASLRQTNRNLVDDVKKLQSDIAALSMPSRIESYAADTLGMQRVDAERLFTLVTTSEKERPSDELVVMFSTIRRVADYLPVKTEAEASSRDLKPIRFDRDEEGDSGE